MDPSHRLNDAAAKAATRIASGVNRRGFLQRGAVIGSGSLAAVLGVGTRAEATHNYSVKSGCGMITYYPNGCGDSFGCGDSPKCHGDYCSGTHCVNGHSPLRTCDGFNCWTWKITCGDCGPTGRFQHYKWTCCDCTCGNQCSSHCSCRNRCICGVREYLGCY